MATNDKLAALAARVVALQEAGVGWTIRETTSGWFVQAPLRKGATRPEATTIPFRDHGRAVPNATAKLGRMGLDADEKALKARQQPAKAAATPAPERAPEKRVASVPPATFVPPTPTTPAAIPTPNIAKESIPVAKSSAAEPVGIRAVAKPQETPIPFKQIEGQVVDLFDVPMNTFAGAEKPRYYKRIVGLRMKDGTERFKCAADEQSCDDTYSTSIAARVHLGGAHPSETALQRRAAAALKAAKEARKSVPAKATPAPATKAAAPAPAKPSVRTAVIAPTPTPAAMPRRTPTEVAQPTTMQQRVDFDTAPERSAAPAAPAAPSPMTDVALNALTAGLAHLVKGYNHYRQVAEQGDPQLQQEVDSLRRQITALEDKLARAGAERAAALLRAQEAERGKEAAEAQLEQLRSSLAPLLQAVQSAA